MIQRMSRVVTVALCVVLSGCKGGGAGQPDLAGTGDMATGPVNKVDILFMMDNSLSTSAFRNELSKRFPQLIKALDGAASSGHPASYHFGVVTSDLGAGTNTSACRAGGDGGKLQVGPSPAISNVPAACSSFTLGGGVRFLDYDQLAGSNNIGGGLDLPTAFNCMAAVGDLGCGFEHVLESVYVALHDPIPENAGFLRPDALLVVVFATDEDDCSAPADSDFFEPSTDHYGPLHSFRCTQYGVTCGSVPRPLTDADAAGPLSDCRPLSMADGGKLFDVQRYIDFFTLPAAMGGVKVNPANVMLAGIMPPAAPFAIRDTAPCGDVANQSSCLILS
ncbi:MAG: hypothetical protein JWN44_6341, partial [Myxococcales bacterium]|nr:hypothetical protein [Myxococcales bacterium]